MELSGGGDVADDGGGWTVGELAVGEVAGEGAEFEGAVGDGVFFDGQGRAEGAVLADAKRGEAFTEAAGAGKNIDQG